MATRFKRALKLWRRNLDVFREYYLASVMGNIGEPILFLFGLGLGLGTMIEDVNGMSYLEFIAPGVMAVVAMNAAAFECMFGSYTRMAEQNVYEGILATPMALEDIVLGEVMWGATKGLMSSVAVLLVLIVAGIFHEYASIPLIIVNMAAIGAAISGIALCVSAVAKSYEFFNFFITLFLTPMILFTGVYFPRERLPELLYDFFLIFPTTHAVAINRFLFYGGDWMPAAIGTTFLVFFVPASVWACTHLIKRRLIPA